MHQPTWQITILAPLQHLMPPSRCSRESDTYTAPRKLFSCKKCDCDLFTVATVACLKSCARHCASSLQGSCEDQDDDYQGSSSRKRKRSARHSNSHSSTGPSYKKAARVVQNDMGIQGTESDETVPCLLSLDKAFVKASHVVHKSIPKRVVRLYSTFVDCALN